MTTRQFLGLMTGGNKAHCLAITPVPDVAMRQVTVWHVIAMCRLRFVS